MVKIKQNLKTLGETLSSGPPPVARRFWQIHHRQRIRLWGIAFVLPTLLFFAVFKYGPMLWAIELSFNSYDMVSAPYFVRGWSASAYPKPEMII